MKPPSAILTPSKLASKGQIIKNIIHFTIKIASKAQIIKNYHPLLHQNWFPKLKLSRISSTSPSKFVSKAQIIKKIIYFSIKIGVQSLNYQEYLLLLHQNLFPKLKLSRISRTYPSKSASKDQMIKSITYFSI